MQHYSNHDLLGLAASKDASFTIPTFVDALNAIRRLTDTDWAEDGIDGAADPEVRQVFAAWRDSIDTNQ